LRWSRPLSHHFDGRDKSAQRAADYWPPMTRITCNRLASVAMSSTAALDTKGRGLTDL
jgi:hypothetical protein